MGSRKPTLGFASRTDAALALSEQGITDRRVIAARIGIDPSCVAALERSAQRRGTPRAPGFRLEPLAHDPLAKLLPDETLTGLRRAAAPRGVSVMQLVARLLSTVVEDDLVGAILDEGRDA